MVILEPRSLAENVLQREVRGGLASICGQERDANARLVSRHRDPD
jgi:hypothetical protein